MSHKFAPGDAVLFVSGQRQSAGAAVTAKITRLLPKEGVTYQYDISLGLDGQQRRVLENELKADIGARTRWPT